MSGKMPIASADDVIFATKFLRFGHLIVNMLSIHFVTEPILLLPASPIRAKMTTPEYDYGFAIGTQLGELWQTWETMAAAEQAYGDIVKAIFVDPILSTHTRIANEQA
jgi:hypothetical protein